MEHSSHKPRDHSLSAGNAHGKAAIVAAWQTGLKGSQLDVEINVLTRHGSSLLTELINHLLLPAKLNCVCYLAMMYLRTSTNNRANPSEISRAIGDTRTNMTRICDELVTKGLMHRVSNADDRRRVDLSLTHKGIALLEEVVPLVRDRVASVMSEFSRDEKMLLVQLMARLNRSLEAYL